jgi:predicted metal-dependent phosphoesterase TrpH
MVFDLHSHTTFSDGGLSPAELIQRAVDCRVDTLAITDHDTVSAHHALPDYKDTIRIIPGIEYSTRWLSQGIHILGLNIDIESQATRTGVAFQSGARKQRAQRIGEVLEKMGVPDAAAQAQKLAGDGVVCRPHFAQYLVNSGVVGSRQEAFKKYLGDGKAGDVKQHWAEMSQIIAWIREAGGIAVLAHPLKYKLSGMKLKRLLDDFIGAGGEGLEVISGKQLPHYTAELTKLCQQKGLLASCGSDFHAPGLSWAELGSFATLSPNIEPVWSRF